ncbi:MAG TPA: ABC transporter permease [Vicinamibacterales bacterium]|nr:ABC transporter permease [Vicinamibacterales bacterium]
MTRDWRAVVRAHVPPLELEREPEILDELSQHLADLYDEAIADGRPADEAFAIACAALPEERERLARDLVTARRSLPGLIADRWSSPANDPPVGRRIGAALVADLRRDVRYAIKSLRRAPGYTLVTLLTLALGIGANSAIFAAVDTILLRPMPYAHADRLVVPVSVNRSRGIDTGSVSFADYTDWHRETDVFEAVALWRPITVDLTGAGQPERIRAVQVSSDYFRVLTMTPVAGRTLGESDHVPKAPRVTVISNGLWRRLFGGAPDVVGRTIRIAGLPYEVVGVLPPRVVWPEEAALFVPLPALVDEDVRTRRDNLIFYSVARLRDSATLERGNALLSAIAARLERDFPESRNGWTNRLQPMREFMVPESSRRALWVLLVAVGAVLLIGCANLAHLGLVRGLSRARELSVRIALGASRWRLVRELGVECLVIGGAGAAAGWVLAVWMIQGLAAMAPDGTPFVEDLRMNVRVLGATVGVTLVAVMLAGVLPAIASSRIQPGPALKDGTPAAGSSRRIRLLRHSLVVAEIAGAVVLLIGAALLIRSFWRLQHVDPGVDVDHVLTARLTLPRTRYASSAESAAFFQNLVDRLAALPGVQSSGATSFVPIGGGGFGLGRVFLAEGRPEPPVGRDVSAQWNVITPDYFQAIGVPVLQGRSFTLDDRAKSTPVVIVSQSFATQMFGTENPLGKRIRSWRDENVLREIVGVVGEVRYTSLDEREISKQVYIPHSQDSWGLMNIVVRSAGDVPGSLEAALRREVRAVDADLAVSNVATLRTIAGESVANQRYMAMLLTILAGTALALGAIGIYGVVNYAVSTRRRELGLRAALGASPPQLAQLVLRQGLRLTAIGLALGLAGALAVSRGLQELLYETEPRDVLAYAITISTIAIVAILASVGPARRAGRVDPLTALRSQ